MKYAFLRYQVNCIVVLWDAGALTEDVRVDAIDEVTLAGVCIVISCS